MTEMQKQVSPRWTGVSYDGACTFSACLSVSVTHSDRVITRMVPRRLEPPLSAIEPGLDYAQPAVARLCYSTLGDLRLVNGDPESALSYYRSNLSAGDLYRPKDVMNQVSALLALDRVDEALSVAETSYFLHREAAESEKAEATLALGMVQSYTDPEVATATLEVATSRFNEAHDANRHAQASLHLARTYLMLGKPREAREILGQAKPGLSELADSGLRLLSGPERYFRDVWSLLREQPTLTLNFLGRREVRLSGKTLELPRRWCDVLALLALHPEGLSGEQLLLLVFG